MTQPEIQTASRSTVTSRINPFPGLRPFESSESALFFGRDEQCDELLARLARRRLVAVVGASGSGKSSLVRAGLLPALQRGYLPTAGSSWQIAVFRPGGTPLANLTDALLAGVGSESGTVDITRETLTDLLTSSSLGLVAAADRLLAGGHGSLLVVVDQFEEIFRFRDLAAGADAEESAVECVNLLLGAAGQDDVPVYVILTMRSDYLGDCARFAGLPEALNDSQFLVPRMTREQLRAAIEGPVAVGGGKIAPRLVQRLLHDVDALAGRTTRVITGAGKTDEYDHDQLPVLQHALMRVWEVSKDLRAGGGVIDLEHYELPPVETIHHALDRHAEEVFAGLPSDVHREIARKVFQRLTDRDWDNREVRRPTPLAELVAVVSSASTSRKADDVAAAVRVVLDEFAAEGRAFVVVNAQQHVDISHESFIRKWMRLRTWLQQENQSRRTYIRLAETASKWEEGDASLYRGPELVEADRWWKRESPSLAWAARYNPGFEAAGRFLRRSLLQQRLRWSALAGGVVAALVIAVVMTGLWVRAREAERRALKAEDDAKVVRNEAVQANEELKKARSLEAEAREAAKAGKTQLAELLNSQAKALADKSVGRQVLTPSEVKEIERLRGLAAASDVQQKKLQDQFNDVNGRLTASATEANRLRDANTTLTRERDNLRDQLKGAPDPSAASKEIAQLREQLKTAGDERDGLRQKLADALAANPGTVTAGDYRDAYRQGVKAYDLKDWKGSVQYMRDAIKFQSSTKDPVKRVPIYGLRMENYAPHSYLAAALFEGKDCAGVMEALKSVDEESPSAPVKSKLQTARAQCSAQK
jgi:energy-coupling factor transporter ATP-binding protein EcfA2